MLYIIYVIVTVRAWCVIVSGAKLSDSSLLTSTYARVAKWGSGSSEPESEARGGSYWSQSPVVNQVKPPPTIVYSSNHRIYEQDQPSDKTDKFQDDAIPGKGEVIQDRFLPKPYFDYGKEKPTNTYGAPPKPAPSYNSPFTSYNPPSPVYKPNPPPPASSPAASAPAPQVLDGPYPPAFAGPPGSDQQKPPSDNTPPDFRSPTLGPPTMPPKPNNSPMMPPALAPDMSIYLPPQPSMSLQTETATAPPPPPGPPPTPDAMPSDHGPHDNGESDMMPPPPPPTAPAADDFHAEYLDHNPYEHGHHHHHHVYETAPPPPPPTMAPPPPPPPPPPLADAGEKKASHYSYFYLGRKLWYLPLYFSIYFIAYIIVLILKAIARHKVDYVQTYARRSMDGRSFDGSRSSLLDDTEVTVRSSIDKARDLYM